MELFIILSIAIVAFYAGWFLRGVRFLFLLSRDPERTITILEQIKKINDREAALEESPEGQITAGTTELKIERHGNMLYAFAKDTDQFIAQGPNLDALIDSAKQRFPDKKFFGMIPNGDPAKELV